MKRSISIKTCKIILAVFILSLALGNPLFADEQDAKGKLDINQASAQELSKLPGIGKKKAEAIVAYRNEKGKFSSVDDLSKIDGIGKKTLEKIRGSLTATGG
ncbi:MAG: helix-hairpin-helix domain-containing protein [Nitrospirae bacterium]|nr:helix-hairpin-helix domain-containing protein [Nitrospirota bacterium]